MSAVLTSLPSAGGHTALINLAYVIYVASALVRSLVPLRLTLLGASIAFIVYGIVADEPSVVLWNVAFGVFSIWELVRIWREQRPVEMDVEQRAAYEAVFHQLTEQEFETVVQMYAEAKNIATSLGNGIERVVATCIRNGNRDE